MNHQHPFDTTPAVSEMAEKYGVPRRRILRALVATDHNPKGLDVKPVHIDAAAEGVAL